MTPIRLHSVLIDTRRRQLKSRIVSSVHQNTGKVTNYPRRSPASIIGLSMVGLAVFGALVMAGWWL